MSISTFVPPVLLRAAPLPQRRSLKQVPTPNFVGRVFPRATSFLPSLSFAHVGPQAVGRSSYVTMTLGLGKVVVAGTGFVATRLIQTLVDGGVDVTVLTTSASSTAHLPTYASLIPWYPIAGGGLLANALYDADLVVNLCGAEILSQWDAEQTQLIRDSRVQSTATLVRTIAAMPEKGRPRCFVSASSTSIYGMRGPAGAFLASVFEEVEDAASPLAKLPGTRLVVIRTGVVLGAGGELVAQMLPKFQKGLGGPIGEGTQWMSWIHVDDLVGMIVAAGTNKSVARSVDGTYNGTAPDAATMNDLSAALARAVGRPNNFPVSEFEFRKEYGEGSCVVLQGQRVRPTRWIEDGFNFKYASINSAMEAIVKEVALVER